MLCRSRLRLMASRNNALNAKRAEILRLQRNSGRKVSRIEKSGIEISGSSFDPRREASKIGRYSMPQLQRLEKSLREFNSRSVQFVADANSKPLPRSEWRKYKQGEKKLVKLAEKAIKPVESEILPGPVNPKTGKPVSKETIGQRQKKIRSAHPTAMNMAYIPPERQPFNIKDIASLRKLTKSNEKRATKDWNAKEDARARKELRKMLKPFKDKELNRQIFGTKSEPGLSHRQFDILWQLTAFADKISLNYHSLMARNRDGVTQDVPDENLKQQIQQAKNLLTWVKKFDV